MNELRWTDTNPAVEIDRVVISWVGLGLVVLLVAVLLWFVYALVGGISILYVISKFRKIRTRDYQH